MDYYKQTKDGYILQSEDKKTIAGPMPEVAVMIERVRCKDTKKVSMGIFCVFQHGEPRAVKDSYDKTRESLLKFGGGSKKGLSSITREMLDDYFFIQGKFPIEELNKLINKPSPRFMRGFLKKYYCDNPDINLSSSDNLMM